MNRQTPNHRTQRSRQALSALIVNAAYRYRTARQLCCFTLAFALSGCAGVGGNLLGLGNSNDKSAEALSAPPIVDDPETRVLQVGLTSVRAQKCGFVLDQEKLQTNYFAYESAKGLPPDQLAGLQKKYAYVRASVASKIAAEENYCTEKRNTEISEDLKRYLAGDFSAREMEKVSRQIVEDVRSEESKRN